MSGFDSSPGPSRETVYHLANAALCGDISEAERQELETLVAESPAARRWYLEFICDACNIRARAEDGPISAAPAIIVTDSSSSALPSPLGAPPVFGVVGNSLHGVVSYFSQVGPLSYLIATFIMLAMGAAAWSWKIPEYRQIAQPTAPCKPNGAANHSRHASIVGRITGMVDCRWEQRSEIKGQRSEELETKDLGLGVPGGGLAASEASGPSMERALQYTEEGIPPSSFIPRPSSSVRLGDRFALVSGLMEITYDSGAKVILQGPCTYEVESAAGGDPSLGKVTARVEKKGSGFGVQHGGLAASEASEPSTEGGSDPLHPSSFIPHPLFAVRTPTATVTDLGTEFGVEVDREGAVETTVFSGRISVLASKEHGGDGRPQILTVGQTARVVTEGQTARISVATDDARRFVRSLDDIQTEVLISPTVCNGSFEQPALGPDNFDADAGNLSLGVYAKIRDVRPAYWDPTSSLQTKGTFARGITGEQYVVLQTPLPVLSIRFDGAEGRPAARNYEPHTVYVLTADIGSNIAGMEAVVSFEDGEHRLRRAIPVSESNVMQAMPPMQLDTDRNREFIGKPIALRFTKRTDGDQLYIDNVTLKAMRRAAKVAELASQ